MRPILAAPRLALAVPFLAKILPGARFVYVHREPREALPRALAAWESGAWVSHPRLPDWPGPPWSLPLTPEWRSLRDRELPEIVVAQWEMTVRLLIDDLDDLPPERWSVLELDSMLDNPGPELERLCRFLQLPEPENIPELDDIRPTADQRRRIEPLLDAVTDRTKESRELVALPTNAAERHQRKAQREPLRSVSTPSMQRALDHLNASLMITTYQTGKPRQHPSQPGNGINTHFRQFDCADGPCPARRTARDRHAIADLRVPQPP